MNRIKPILAFSSFSTGKLAAGNSLAYKAGAIHPKKEGPNRRPATISPITGGCPKRPAIAWNSRQIARIPAICNSRRSRVTY